MNYKGRNINFTIKRPGKEILRKQTRLTSPEIRYIGIVFSQYYALKEGGKIITSVVFLPKVYNLNLISIQKEKSSNSN